MMESRDDDASEITPTIDMLANFSIIYPAELCELVVALADEAEVAPSPVGKNPGGRMFVMSPSRT